MGSDGARQIANSRIITRFAELGGMMAEKILVIEDSATFRALLTATLRQKGYEVVGAETGLAGVRIAKKELPNAISLDLSLPDISGVEVLSSLKQDNITSQIPVIICTACVDGGVREEVLQSGAAEILTKPVQPAHLFAALDRQLRRV
jgi:DNA-binding response OmpR family regulator